MSARDMLVSCIRESGMSITDYAERVMARHRSTVYRWLSGEQDVPKAVERWLAEQVKGLSNVDAVDG